MPSSRQPSSNVKSDTVKDYGVWFARPISYKVEYKEDDDEDPHIYLTFRDKSQKNFKAAINIKSGDTKDTRLAFWLNKSLDPSVISDFKDLKPGFHSLEGNAKGLDYLRDTNLFDHSTGRILPHDIDGPNNDIIDVLTPHLDRSINERATIYIFGSRFNTKDGLHDVHMNQGSPPRYAHGVQQDGALLFHFEEGRDGKADEWVGVFLGFASQRTTTDDRSGLEVPGAKSWANILNGERDD